MTSGEYDSIIAFYNQVFMQSLKTFVMQFANNRVTIILLTLILRYYDGDDKILVKKLVIMAVMYLRSY